MATRQDTRQGLASIEEAAAYLNRSPGTLANWRSQRRGPRYVQDGPNCLVRYRWRDLDAWIDERTH